MFCLGEALCISAVNELLIKADILQLLSHSGWHLNGLSLKCQLKLFGITANRTCPFKSVRTTFYFIF